MKKSSFGEREIHMGRKQSKPRGAVRVSERGEEKGEHDEGESEGSIFQLILSEA